MKSQNDIWFSIRKQVCGEIHNPSSKKILTTVGTPTLALSRVNKLSLTVSPRILAQIYADVEFEVNEEVNVQVSHNVWTNLVRQD